MTYSCWKLHSHSHVLGLCVVVTNHRL